MQPRRTHRSLVLCLGLALLAGACGAEDDLTSDFDGLEPEVEQLVAELNDYWSQADTEIAFGFDYEPIALDQLTTGDDGTVCDGNLIRASEVEQNAFVAPCEEGIIVAYDPDYVLDSTARLEATFAHEWGHVLQAQAGNELDISKDPNGLPIDAELQADCLAGAFNAERGVADIEQLIADVETAGDPPGVAIHEQGAHGTAEERTAAYELGLDLGPAACVEQLFDILPG